MMQLYQLHQFLAIAETGSFTKAAERLNVAQPALSIGISKLEKELGVTLFDRAGPKVALTSYGHRLLKDAREITQKCADIRKSVRLVKERDTVKIGMLRTIPCELISRVLKQLRSDQPNIHFEIVDLGHDAAVSMLKRGRIHLAISLRDGADLAFPFTPLYEERYVAVVHKQHRLASRARIEIEDFRDEPFILRTSCEIFNANQELFSARGIRVKNVCRTDQDDRALTLIENAEGSTIMPESFRSPNTVQIVINGYFARRTIGVLSRTEENGTIEHGLIRTLERYFASENADAV